MQEAGSWRARYDEVVDALRQAGVGQAETDSRWILEAASGASIGELFADRVPATEAMLRRLESMCDRRATGEPVQYVVGEWAFRTLELSVDHRVLIPRPETEVVVEVALATLAGATHAPRRVADLGTGSGAIALAIATEAPDVEVWATDVSTDALDVARANGLRNGATRVHWRHGSWFEALERDLYGTFDLVVSNPPYVGDGERGSLPAEVVDHEPREALFSGPTGLEAIETIVSASPTWLRRGGTLVVEIAPHQSVVATDLAGRAGFPTVTVEPDLAGRPRALVAVLD